MPIGGIALQADIAGLRRKGIFQQEVWLPITTPILSRF